MTRGAAGPHLSDDELVDLADEVLPPERRRHVDACAPCRDRAATWSAALRATAELDVPEPPPFFWESFSARVRSAVAAEPEPRRGFWRALSPAPAVWTALAAAAVMAIAVSFWPGGGVRHAAEPALTGTQLPYSGGVAAGVNGDETFLDIEKDEAWALVRSVADSVAVDEMGDAGIGLWPGSADGIAGRLTDRERLELARLLAEALERPSTSESSS